MTEEEGREKLKLDGFKIIGIHTFDPDLIPEEHAHDETTAHIILEGDLIIQDKEGEERVYHVGEYFQFPAGTTHTATPGPNGCRFLVGVKEVN